MKRNFTVTFLLICLLFSTLGNAESQKNNLKVEPNITVALQEMDKYSVTDLHNRIRCQVSTPALSMSKVTWNNTLYQVAQNFANKCVFQHNSNRSQEYAALGGQGYVGENIFAIGPTGPSIFLATAIRAFASEKVNFSYVPTCTSGVCGCTNFSNCGHYSQLIWNASTTVACAQADCQNTSLGGQFVVCDYAPGGNYVGEAPYQAASKGMDTAACQAARILPLLYFSTLSASSNETQLPNVLDPNIATAWYPSSTDSSPFIAISLKQTLNVQSLRIQWTDSISSASLVQIEYSNNADGSNPSMLPVQALPKKINATIQVNLSQIRYLKINFLQVYGPHIGVASLAAVDPSFSWNWH